MKITILTVLVCFFGHVEAYSNQFVAPDPLSYPHFQNNPHIDEIMRRKMAPYLLPLDHPVKPMLDVIFSQNRVTESEQSLLEAGFTLISASMPWSFATIARHPAVPGYVFKLYLDTETRHKEGIPNWEWLTRRCIGAESIRRVIQQKNICHFTVPDKWLYVLPLYPASKQHISYPVIVVETDEYPENQEITEFAWKYCITPEYLDELYEILKKGYGTIGLVRNLPYTKNRQFVFIDTEYPPRNHDLKKVKRYLSKDMRRYWDSLID